MKKLTPLCCALLLALAGSLCAAETELIGAQRPWRVFLRMGPYVARKDGKLVVGYWSRPLDLAKAEFLKDWTARHSPSPADGWFRADFDDSGWGRYQTDELGARTAGGYGGGFEQAYARIWPDRFHLRRLLVGPCRFGRLHPGQRWSADLWRLRSGTGLRPGSGWQRLVAAAREGGPRQSRYLQSFSAVVRGSRRWRDRPATGAQCNRQ